MMDKRDKMKSSLFFLLILLSFSTLAAIEVTKIRGDVKIAGESITKLGPLKVKSGLVETSFQSYVQFKVDSSGSLLTVAPNSKIELDEEKEFTHQAGQVLYKIQTKEAAKKTKVVLKTKVAALGVRGTEFMVIANPLLEETEIVTFEGAVVFQSLQNNGDKKLVKAGQWGGIGGRFGNEIGDLMDLPTNILDTFKGSFNF